MSSAGHKPTTDLTAEDVLARMRLGATLHYGLAPGARRKKSWWLEPTYIPVASSVVNEIRAITRPELKVEIL